MELKNYPYITVIIPLFNERKYVNDFMNSLINQSYPSDKITIIAIDGNSDDETLEILRSIQENIRTENLICDFIILQNLKRHVPYGLNDAIRLAATEIIVRLDAHTIYPPDYLKILIYWKIKLNAQNVGCSLISKGRTKMGKSIAFAMSSSLGIGNSLFRVSNSINEPIEVDTVPFGVFEKSFLAKTGYFDIRFHRHQDYELNHRIIKNEGRIFLVPGINASYYVRDNIKDLFIQYYRNGIYKGRFIKLHKVFKIRHIIPITYSLVIIIYMLLIPFITLSLNLALFSFLILPYILFILYSSYKLKMMSGQKVINFMKILPVLHISYGFGALIGLLKKRFNHDMYF